jgi:hypothetical protein
MAKNKGSKKAKKEKLNQTGSLPVMETAQEIAPGKKKNTY